MGRLFELILTQPLFNALILLTVWIPGHSLGWAIIALTVIIRILLVPSAAHGLMQQHKLRAMQPEIQALQQKHKDDKETQAREMMALYKKYDIHPLGSCLPMLVQLPILFALYFVFQQGLDTSHFDLLYPFVPRPEALNTNFVGIDLSKSSIILALIAGGLQYVQSWMLLKSPKTHQAENDTQRILNLQLLYFMPIVTTLVSISLPAALPLYWATTNLFAVGQQWWLFRHLPEPVIVQGTPPEVSPATEGPIIPQPTKAESAGQVEKHGSVVVRVRRKGEA